MYLNLLSGNVLYTSSALKLMAGENDRTMKAVTTCHLFVFGKHTVYLFTSSAHEPLLRDWIGGENFFVLTNSASVREPKLREVCFKIHCLNGRYLKEVEGFNGYSCSRKQFICLTEYTLAGDSRFAS